MINGANIINPLEENAIIFTDGDNNTFPFLYFQCIEERRLDVIHIFITGLLYDWYTEDDECWYMNQIKERYPNFSFNFPYKKLGKPVVEKEEEIKHIRIENIILNNYDTRPIYLHYDEELAKKYFLFTAGIFYKVFNKQLNKEQILENLKKEIKFKYRKFDLTIFKGRGLLETFNTYNNYAHYYHYRGCHYHNIGMDENAIIEFKKALKINPKLKESIRNLGEAYNNLGNMYNIKGMHKRAIIEYEKAIKATPDYIEPYANLGIIYTKEGKVKKAIEVWKQVIKRNPTDIKSRWNLAVLYFNKNLFEKSAKECSYILDIDPQNIQAKQMLKVISAKKIKGG